MVTNGSEAAAWEKAEENFDFLSGEAPWETLLDHQDIPPGGDPVSTNTAFDQWYNDLIPSDSTDNKISATDFEWPSTVNPFELTLKEMPVSPMSQAAKSSITLYQTKRLDDEKFFLSGIKGMKFPDFKVDLFECSQMPKEGSHPPQDDMHENSQPSAKQLPISPSPSEPENKPPTVPEPPNFGPEWQQNPPTTVLPAGRSS